MKLDNKKIYDALILGAHNVMNQKDLLNGINVFPIQDNDTGNNLSAMMQSIIYKAKLGQTIDETLNSVAEAALSGSRGNSGLIFSQYLYGLPKTFSTGDNTKNYQLRFQSAVQYAYDAISNPVEGTMITLMKRLSQLLSEQMDTKRLENSLTHIYENLKTTLDETTNSLEILKKHQVVDADTLGFMLFIEGFMQSILNQKSYELGISQKQVHPLHNHQILSDHINNRYCMEVLLKTFESKLHLTTLLNNLGDSLVIGKQDELIRIHIHTNQPNIIIEKVKPLGMILETKVDDMQKQYQAIHDDANDIAILTDSIADLPQSLIDDYPIYVFGSYIAWSILIFFFISSSIISKFNKNEKEKFGRDYIQVISNSVVSLFFLTLYYFLHDLTYLIVAVVAIAASTADTWASEIGSLSKGKTYSIVTFKAMEKGLSGAVSMLGVVASFLGASIISLTFSALYFLSEGFSLDLFIEFSVVITISGFFGSILDSYLGVFLQAKYKDIKSGKIAEMISNTEHFILISGKKFVNNSTVNFIMVLTISLVTYLLLVI